MRFLMLMRFTLFSFFIVFHSIQKSEKSSTTIFEEPKEPEAEPRKRKENPYLRAEVAELQNARLG
jgi:hypothetical protein